MSDFMRIVVLEGAEAITPGAGGNLLLGDIIVALMLLVPALIVYRVSK